MFQQICIKLFLSKCTKLSLMSVSQSSTVGYSHMLCVDFDFKYPNKKQHTTNSIYDVSNFF